MSTVKLIIRCERCKNIIKEDIPFVICDYSCPYCGTWNRVHIIGVSITHSSDVIFTCVAKSKKEVDKEVDY